MLVTLAHLPYDPEPGGPTREVSGSASRGEIVSLSFSLSSTSSTGEIELSLSPLLGPRGHPLHGELYVVHRWLQSGRGVFQHAALEVPELLLKDDRAPLRDGYRRRCASFHHAHWSRSRYVAPDVRLTGHVNTTIEAGHPRQFWVALPVAQDSPAGRYAGAVTVRAGGKSISELPIVVDVLPITLLEPQQDLMIWYRGTINCHHPHHYVSPAAFRAQLEDIYSHGFRSISLWETDRSLMQRAVDMANAAGFSANIVLDGYNRDLWSSVDFGSLTPVAYVSDEPDGNSREPFTAHAARFHAARTDGVPTMASLVHSRTRRSFGLPDDPDVQPDIVSLYAPANLAQLQLTAAPIISSGNRTSFYWQAHMEKPLVHRLLAGLFLWKCGADGISPYCYQHLPGAPHSPFDDFDPWDPGAHDDVGGRRFRDHFATYPARRGSIPTVQWKGLSDGLTDLRYLVTLEAMLNRAERSPAPEVRAHAGTIRKRGLPLVGRVQWLDLDILSDTSELPCSGISASDFRGMRESVGRDIIALSKTLES